MTESVNEGSAPNRDVFLEAMAHVAGPVTLVTTGSLEYPEGLVASAVCSLSADPPSILVCINKQASAHDSLIKYGKFAVNFLGFDQGRFASLFSRKNIDRFVDEDWTILSTGAPVLGSALVAFDCRLHSVTDGFSHSILVGAVQDIQITEMSERRGLVWHRRKFCQASELPEHLCT